MHFAEAVAAFDIQIQANQRSQPDEDCGDCGIWAAVRPAYSLPFLITDSNRSQALLAREKWIELLEAGDLAIESQTDR